MDRIKALVALLAVVVVAESTFIALPLLRPAQVGALEHAVGSPERYNFSYTVFNRPISNDTDVELNQTYRGSWVLTVKNTLEAASASGDSEAQVALAPAYPVENLSIPTIIVQERSDGLVRVEYFAQNWPGTFGLVLYNSTSKPWMGGAPVTLRFTSFGPPSPINPSLAPRPNGNLTITIGNQVVVSEFMIAWSSLGALYLYGLRSSTFDAGNVTVSVQALARG